MKKEGSPYSIEEAQKEAGEIKGLVDKGLATDYQDAEAKIEAQANIERAKIDATDEVPCFKQQNRFLNYHPLFENVVEKTTGLFSVEPRLMKTSFLPLDEQTGIPEESRKESIAQVLGELRKNPAMPVILQIATFEKASISGYIDNPDIREIIKYPNVRIASLNVLDVATQFTNKNSRPDVETSDDTGLKSQLYSMHHDLIQHKKDYTKFLKQVREMGIAGSDEEILQLAKEGTATAKWEQKDFTPIKGVFSDWEGTLFVDNKLNRDLLEEVRKKAQEEGVKPAIWTGGNVTSVYRILQKEGIEDVDVCSKMDCRGLEVSAAYDDLPAEELLQNYGVKIKELHQV